MPPKRKSLRIKEIQDSAVGLIFTLHSTVDAYDIVQTNMATKEKQPIFSLPKIKGIVNREFVEHVVTLYGEWAMGIINKSTIADAIQYFKEVLTIIEGIGLTTLKDVPIAQNATISTIIISALESLKVSAQHAAELCPTNTDIAKLLPAIDISLGRVSSFAHQDTEITIAYYLNAITHTKQLLGTKSTQSSTDLYEIFLESSSRIIDATTVYTDEFIENCMNITLHLNKNPDQNLAESRVSTTSYIAYFLHHAKHYDKALELYHVMRKSIPTQDAQKKAEILNAIANVYYDRDNTQSDALLSFTQGAKLFLPKTIFSPQSTYQELSQQYFENGFYSLAIDLSHKTLIHENPNTGNQILIHTIIASSHQKIGYPKTALTHITQAISMITPDIPFIDLVQYDAEIDIESYQKIIAQIRTQPELQQKLQTLSQCCTIASRIHLLLKEYTKASQYYKLAAWTDYLGHAPYDDNVLDAIDGAVNTDGSFTTAMEKYLDTLLYKKVFPRAIDVTLDNFIARSLTLTTKEKATIVKLCAIKTKHFLDQNHLKTYERFQKLTTEISKYSQDSHMKSIYTKIAENAQLDKDYFHLHSLVSHKSYTEAVTYYYDNISNIRKLPFIESIECFIKSNASLITLASADLILHAKAIDNMILEIKAKTIAIQAILPRYTYYTAELTEQLGAAYLIKHDVANAEKYFQEAFEIFTLTSSDNITPPQLTLTGTYVAKVLYERKDFVSALNMLTHIMKLKFQITEKTALAAEENDIENLSRISRDCGDTTQAIVFMRKAVSIREAIYAIDTNADNTLILGFNYHALSRLHLTQCLYDTALEYGKKALNILENLSQASHYALDTLYGNADIYFLKQDYIGSIQCMCTWLSENEALISQALSSPTWPSTAQTLFTPYNMHTLYLQLSTAYFKIGNTELALHYAQCSIAFKNHITDNELYNTYHSIAEIYITLHNTSEALMHLMDAVHVAKRTNNTYQEGDCNKMMGLLFTNLASTSQDKSAQQKLSKMALDKYKAAFVLYKTKKVEAESVESLLQPIFLNELLLHLMRNDKEAAINSSTNTLVYLDQFDDMYKFPLQIEIITTCLKYYFKYNEILQQKDLQILKLISDNACKIILIYQNPKESVISDFYDAYEQLKQAGSTPTIDLSHTKDVVVSHIEEMEQPLIGVDGAPQEHP